MIPALTMRNAGEIVPPRRRNLPGIPNPEECHDMAINTLLHVLTCSKAKKSHTLVLDEEASHAL